MTAEFFVGRADAALSSAQSHYVDSIFAAGRYEGVKFSQLRIEHSTFANNSFKGSEIDQCTFVNVVFVGVYFRDTVLKSCRFEGCKFIDCDMSRVDIRSCTIKFYNTFSNTFLPFDRVSESLPEEGNLRQQLCSNLSREASLAGEYVDAGKFRAASVRGELKFVKAVATRRNPYYKQKYDVSDQLLAVVKLVKVNVSNLIWGSTRSHWVVLRNWLLVAASAFVVFAIFGRNHLDAGSTWWQAGVYGFISTIPIEPLRTYALDGPLINTLTIAYRFLGLMFAAIFGALLFARVYEGRR